jgi:hypothetical protein
MRLILIILIISTTGLAQVSIHEVVTDNEDVFFDEFGKSPDWIELANLGRDTISLDGYGLSDSRTALYKWRFPSESKIFPQSVLMVLANGEDNSIYLNTNFELSRLGETIYLTTPSGNILDSLVVPKLAEDQGYGRLPDSSGTFYFRNVSPERLNVPEQIDPVSSIKIISSPGKYRHGDTIRLAGSEDCEEIYFSVDGSQPTEIAGEDDFFLLPRIQEDLSPYFAHIPTRREYKLPREVPRFPFLRVRCDDASLSKFSEDGVGLPDRNIILARHKMPVVLIEVDEGDFFSFEEGIYVEGEDVNYEKNGKAWKKPIEWTYMDGSDVSKGSAFAEIHGHATRSLPQKSLKLTRIRTLPDSSVGWPELYENDGFPFTEIVLRSMHSEFVGNEFTDYGFRDDLIMSMIYDELDVYAQNARIVSVYINGEYWGIHSLRESSEEDHIAREEGLDIEEVIIENGAQHVFNLYNRIKDLDPSSPVAYVRLSEIFDIPNLVDYVLAETWFNNLDWPFNNIKTWRSKGTDRPYRFILFDMDACLKYPRLSPFSRFIQANVPSRDNPDHYLFFEKLLSFPEFRQDVQNRYNELTSTVFRPEMMLEKLDRLSETLEPEVNRHILRWHYPRDFGSWEASRDDIKHFLLTRRIYFDEALLSLDPGRVYPNPASEEIFVDDLPSNLESYRWTTTSGHIMTPWTTLSETSIPVPEELAINGSILLLECKGDHVYRSYPVLIQK